MGVYLGISNFQEKRVAQWPKSSILLGRRLVGFLLDVYQISRPQSRLHQNDLVCRYSIFYSRQQQATTSHCMPRRKFKYFFKTFITLLRRAVKNSQLLNYYTSSRCHFSATGRPVENFYWTSIHLRRIFGRTQLAMQSLAPFKKFFTLLNVCSIAVHQIFNEYEYYSCPKQHNYFQCPNFHLPHKFLTDP